MLIQTLKIEAPGKVNQRNVWHFRLDGWNLWLDRFDIVHRVTGEIVDCYDRSTGEGSLTVDDVPYDASIEQKARDAFNERMKIRRWGR